MWNIFFTTTEVIVKQANAGDNININVVALMWNELTLMK